MIRTLFVFLFCVGNYASYSQWELSHKDVDSTIIFDELAVPSADSAFCIGYSAGGSVLYATSDGGASWSPLAFPFNDSLTGIDFPSPSIGYITGSMGVVYKTVDGGQSWIASGIIDSMGFETIRFDNPDSGIVSRFDGPDQFNTPTGALYLTENGGGTWNSLGGLCSGFEAEYVDDSITMMAGEFLVKYSTDLGMCQREQIFSWGGYSFSSGEIALNLNMDVLGMCGWRTDGANQGFPNNQYGLLELRGTPAYFRVYFPEIQKVYDLELTDSVMYIVSQPYLQNAHFGVSKDKGQSWYYQQCTEPGGVSVDSITNIRFANDSVGFACGGNAIYRTMNGGGAPIDSLATGLSEMNGYNELMPFEVFPNPTKSALNIKRTQAGFVGFRIYDMSGRIVKTGQISGINDMIDVSSLMEGTYIIDIENSRGMFVKI